jgi:Zn-dependent protease
MFGRHQGSIPLFRFAGVDVFLHWSWFLVAVFEINSRVGKYSSIAWNVLEYLALFLLVLLHEYGHALACKNVGGIATRIVLWPLGGLAYVDPPPRPGATLWSIAAGPLVNVVFFPIFFILFVIIQSLGWAKSVPNAYQLVLAVTVINMVLLVFNLLPIYPLDGGQILRSLLWFVLGKARSLMAATLIGFLGVAGLIVFAFRAGSVWFGVMSLFIVLNCWAGLKQSIVMLRLTKLPRRDGFACPWCKAAPPLGNYWTCGACRTIFDIFETQAICPYCATQFTPASCIDCGKPHLLSDWIVPALSTPQPQLQSRLP